MKAIGNKAIFRTWIISLFLLVPSVSQAAIISVDSVSGGAIDNSVDLNVGDSFTIDVLIQDIIDLAGFQFTLGFDSSVLAATSVISGDIFGLDTFLINDSIGADNVIFSEATFALNGVDIVGPAKLATISFDAIASGTSALSLSAVVFSDSLGATILPVDMNNAMANVNRVVGVPAPVSFLLMLVGLSMFFTKRKLSKSL